MKRLQGAICGFLVAAVIFTMAPSLAATIEAAFNAVNITLNGSVVATKGTGYQLPNGTTVPYSILYQGTTYLPVRKVSELLNVNIDWDSATGTVEIGNSGSANTGNASVLPSYESYPEVPDFGAIFDVEPFYVSEEPTGYAYLAYEVPAGALEQYRTILEDAGFEYLGSSYVDSLSTDVDYYGKGNLGVGFQKGVVEGVEVVVVVIAEI